MLKIEIQKVTGIEGDKPVVISVRYNEKTHSSGALVAQEGIVSANLVCQWNLEEDR